MTALLPLTFCAVLAVTGSIVWRRRETLGTSTEVTFQEGLAGGLFIGAFACGLAGLVIGYPILVQQL